MNTRDTKTRDMLYKSTQFLLNNVSYKHETKQKPTSRMGTILLPSSIITISGFGGICNRKHDYTAQGEHLWF